MPMYRPAATPTPRRRRTAPRPPAPAARRINRAPARALPAPDHTDVVRPWHKLLAIAVLIATGLEWAN